MESLELPLRLAARTNIYTHVKRRIAQENTRIGRVLLKKNFSRWYPFFSRTVNVKSYFLLNQLRKESK